MDIKVIKSIIDRTLIMEITEELLKTIYKRAEAYEERKKKKEDKMKLKDRQEKRKIRSNYIYN